MRKDRGIEIDTLSCTDCDGGLFYFFSINGVLHGLCRACRHIAEIEGLKSELKEKNEGRGK